MLLENQTYIDLADIQVDFSNEYSDLLSFLSQHSNPFYYTVDTQARTISANPRRDHHYKRWDDFVELVEGFINNKALDFENDPVLKSHSSIARYQLEVIDGIYDNLLGVARQRKDLDIKYNPGFKIIEC